MISLGIGKLEALISSNVGIVNKILSPTRVARAALAMACAGGASPRFVTCAANCSASNRI